MKVIWFGRRCVRLHIGGKIVLLWPEQAIPQFDGHELAGAADLVFGEAEVAALPVVDAVVGGRKRLIDVLDDPELDHGPRVERTLDAIHVYDAEDGAVIVATGPTCRFGGDARVLCLDKPNLDAILNRIEQGVSPALVLIGMGELDHPTSERINHAGSRGVAFQLLEPGYSIEI